MASSAVSTETVIEARITAEEAPPPPPGGGGGGPVDPSETPNFNINVYDNNKIITLESSRKVKYILTIGVTESLEMGVVDEDDNLFFVHKIKIPPDLEPGVYYYEVKAIDSKGNFRISDIGSFVVYYPPKVSLSVLNVIGLSGKLISESEIELNWNNPTLGPGEFVRIVRSNKFYPLDVNDGNPIYEGLTEYHMDSRGVSSGNIYYYSAFVCDILGRCTYGASTYVVNPLRSGSEGTPPTFFIDGEEYSIEDILSEDFLVYQKKVLVSPENNIHNVGYGDDLILSFKPRIDLGYVHSVVIGVKKLGVFDAEEYLYLTQKNESSGYFETSRFSLEEGGNYGVFVRVFDHKKNTISTYFSMLFVESLPKFPERKIFGGLIESSGFSLGFLQLLGILAGIGLLSLQHIRSVALIDIKYFYQIYIFVLRRIGILFLFKKREWGVVYDSVTKRPIDSSRVFVSNMEKDEVLRDISDEDGRYGFKPKKGKYILRVDQESYIYPTKILEGQIKDETYEDLYHGELFEIKDNDEKVRKNIPVDPIGFKWEEFVKNKKEIIEKISKKEMRWNLFLFIVYSIAFLSTIALFVYDPTPLNTVIFSLFSLFVACVVYLIGKTLPASVKTREAGELLSFSVLRIFSVKDNVYIKTSVADGLGRFSFSVDAGEYYLTIDEKLPDGSYKMIHKTDIVHLSKFGLRRDIVI